MIQAQSQSIKFTLAEKTLVFQVAFIIFVRMSALFFPLPIFSSLGTQFEGSTSFLVGVAIGIYALAQACLQIPLGYLSDKLGRKPVIIGGLLLFLSGSIACALAQSIEQMIFARFVQGLGAVSSTLTALVADCTRENQRTKSMAIIGASVGSAFFISTVSSPFVAHYLGLSQLFWLIGFLAFMALIIAFYLPNLRVQKQKKIAPLKQNFFGAKLLYLDYCVFMAHFVLSANFFVLPLMLINNWQIALSQHWLIYLLALVGCLPLIFLTIHLVDKLNKISQVFYICALLLIVSHLLFIFNYSAVFLILAMLLFFSGFSALETLLPSLASKQTTHHKGLVMGVFSSCQQMGSAFGAMCAGLIGFAHYPFIFGLNLLLFFIWLLINKAIAHQFNSSQLQ